MPMTGAISGLVTSKDKAKSNALAREKSQDLIKICGKFLVFPSVIKKRQLPFQKGYQHHSLEVKRTGIINQQAQMINSP